MPAVTIWAAKLDRMILWSFIITTGVKVEVKIVEGAEHDVYWYYDKTAEEVCQFLRLFK